MSLSKGRNVLRVVANRNERAQPIILLDPEKAEDPAGNFSREMTNKPRLRSEMRRIPELQFSVENYFSAFVEKDKEKFFEMMILLKREHGSEAEDLIEGCLRKYAFRVANMIHEGQLDLARIRRGLSHDKSLNTYIVKANRERLEVIDDEFEKQLRARFDLMPTESFWPELPGPLPGQLFDDGPELSDFIRVMHHAFTIRKLLDYQDIFKIQELYGALGDNFNGFSSCTYSLYEALLRFIVKSPEFEFHEHLETRLNQFTLNPYTLSEICRGFILSCGFCTNPDSDGKNNGKKTLNPSLQALREQILAELDRPVQIFELDRKTQIKVLDFLFQSLLDIGSYVTDLDYCDADPEARLTDEKKVFRNRRLQRKRLLPFGIDRKKRKYFWITTLPESGIWILEDEGVAYEKWWKISTESDFEILCAQMNPGIPSEAATLKCLEAKKDAIRLSINMAREANSETVSRLINFSDKLKMTIADLASELETGKLCSMRSLTFFGKNLFHAQDFDSIKTHILQLYDSIHKGAVNVRTTKYFYYAYLALNENWKDLIDAAENFSQLHLLVELLNTRICWEKGITNRRCKKCDSRDKKEDKVLCEKCFSVYHWKCLQPTGRKRRTGWICDSCTELKDDDEVENKPIPPPDVVELYQDYFELCDPKLLELMKEVPNSTGRCFQYLTIRKYLRTYKTCLSLKAAIRKFLRLAKQKFEKTKPKALRKMEELYTRLVRY
ncbi:unnamed protein product [Caenorhabditis auriculariae]|uniref:PHD-type domain-containing protein n=1 Tax=Caenorhabditis auriculariae TaxID=2777116 RepID=A0A8S1HJV6_9PELO|nr:unnamed protein product [Caenorhabditis auriculariae]